MSLSVRCSHIIKNVISFVICNLNLKIVSCQHLVNSIISKAHIYIVLLQRTIKKYEYEKINVYLLSDIIYN